MVTDAKDFDLLGDPSKMTGYSRPPETKLTAATRVLGVCTAVGSLPANILWLQWLGATGVLLAITATGMQVGMMSPYLSEFTTEGSSILLTLNEASWTISLVGIGRALGALSGSIVNQYLGTKKTLLISSLLFLVPWICLLLVNSAIWLYAMGLCRGIATGLLYVSFPIYLGEVASPTRRGAMVSYAMGGLPLGAMLGTVMATYISRSLFSSLSLALACVNIFIYIYVPESPHFLVRTGQLEEARKSLQRYNPSLVVEHELVSIKEFVTELSSFTYLDQLRALNNPRNIKAAMIILALHVFMYFSGLNTLIYYMEIILKDGMVTVVEPATVVTIANVLDVISGFGMAYKVDKYGRRVVWIISSLGASLSIIGLGLRFTLFKHGYDSDGYQWLPILCMICYRIFLFVGICSVPSVYLSELLAPNVKTVVVSIIHVLGGVMVFTATKSYQPLVDTIGVEHVYYINGVFLMLAVIFGATILPETSGKSLQEIQKM